MKVNFKNCAKYPGFKMAYKDECTTALEVNKENCEMNTTTYFWSEHPIECAGKLGL